MLIISNVFRIFVDNLKYNVYEIIRKYIKGAKRDTPIYT